ncbi:MAG: hypothetical protein P8J87_03500, partial [Verrucomicrobiales bacterium]|nr:hypothetical protein [Verrucomicrobiales bacterium]
MNIIPLPCRDRLTPEDFKFIGEALDEPGKPHNAVISLLTDPDSRDAVLNHPALLGSILDNPDFTAFSPELYFYVLVHHTLVPSGLAADTELVDFVASSLADYARAHPSSSGAKSPLPSFAYYTDFIGTLEKTTTHQRFYVYLKFGNHFLALTGLFHHYIQARQLRRSTPGIDFYEGAAATAYRMASEHPLAGEFNVRPTLRRLASSIHTTRAALNHLADEYLALAC